MARVVCAGHVNWDVTLEVDRLPAADGEAAIQSQRQSGGGSASNAAVALAGLDLSAHLLGSVGADEYGWLARRELADAGVDTHLVDADAGTAMKYLVVDADGEVMVLGMEGGNEAYAASDLPADTLEAAAFLHLTNQAPATAAALAERAGAADVPVSFDPGRRLPDRDFADTLAATDLLFCNEREYAECDAVEAVPTVVEKRGADGAAVHADGETIAHPGYLVESVDTSGAGDAFDAGFLAARSRGDDLETALAVANACGALAARTSGARLHLNWDDVEAVRDVGPAEE